MAPSPVPVESLCEAFTSRLPVQGAAIATLGDPFEVEAVCASDPVAASFLQTQLDLGVGPCWRARATSAPVLLSDVERDAAVHWPMLLPAIRSHGIRSVYAFPMSVGTLEVGVVDLYASRPAALSGAHLADASALAGTAALRVLEKALDDLDAQRAADPPPRRFIHQATGMVIAQLRIAPDDALLMIRAHAFATDRTVREVAEAIIARDIDFSL